MEEADPSLIHDLDEGSSGVRDAYEALDVDLSDPVVFRAAVATAWLIAGLPVTPGYIRGFGACLNELDPARA